MSVDSGADFLTLSEDRRSHDRLVRSSRRRNREPKFISFQTKDDHIEIEIDFNIPFLSIPVKKSVDGVSSFIKGPLVNVNLGAVALAGIMAIGGAFIGSFARTFSGQNPATSFGPFNFGRTENTERPGAERKNVIWTLWDGVEQSLSKFDIDTTACTQRTICWYVKEAKSNVDEKKASGMDVVINGLSSANWALSFVNGTAIEDAINAGRRNYNCEQSFPSCRIGPQIVQQFLGNGLKPEN
ncbi:uncharacterized protein LOC129763399 [Toxorhynchites rutilus septentrionalis]|uniref:uncharacterized protein LOC129763399 n=1 Tax=Toxorhynchites rutilus septentrionalis TaxID=329112 RepID=UPI002478E52C|nr:uncharacterized protein LOC129763399 [Toxorhynchites rutilus septentrionalis]